MLFFFFNDTATTEIYTLSLHDALPISERRRRNALERSFYPAMRGQVDDLSQRRIVLNIVRARVDVSDIVARDVLAVDVDRKSTRLNSSHANISYAVFCLKKKN